MGREGVRVYGGMGGGGLKRVVDKVAWWMLRVKKKAWRQVLDSDTQAARDFHDSVHQFR